ncbi:MAG: AAA family ATPase, partial [Bacteroidales bacterium]|nr:AAA family ATPase [Bacteroidales bacterium]
MKLSAFRIRNFRSIIDTNWTRLAPDNITALIGQNESGKTSILEALNSFSTQVITVDMLRSDQSLPIISVEFQLDKKEKIKYALIENIPATIASQIQKSGVITLNREWKNLNDSYLYYGDEEVLREADEKEKSENEIVDELIAKAEKILLDTSRLVELASDDDQNRGNLQNELNLMESRMDALERILQRKWNDKKKGAAREELGNLQKEQSVLKTRFDKIDASYQKAQEKISSMIHKTDYAEKFMNSLESYLENEKSIAKLKDQIAELKENIEFEISEKVSNQLKSSMANAIDQLKRAKKNHLEIKSTYLFAKECFALTTSGTGNNIEKRALERVENLTSELTLRQLAEVFIEDIPEIHLFEDFSSLLPNRIDLEDILDMNTRVEGYNAAKNFLIV